MFKSMKKVLFNIRFMILRVAFMLLFLFVSSIEVINRIINGYTTSDIKWLNIYPFNKSDVKSVFLLVTFMLLGRYFCGWICPLGLFSDIFEKIVGPLRKRYLKLDIKINHKLDSLMFFLPVIITPFLLPYFVAGNSFVVLSFMAVCFFSMVLVNGKIPCKYLCMAGFLPGLLSTLSPFYRKKMSQCDSCGSCDTRCSMKIDSNGNSFYKNLYCTRCFECTSTCKKGALKWKFRGAGLFTKNKQEKENI